MPRPKPQDHPYCASVNISDIDWGECIYVQGIGLRACRKCCHLATEHCTGLECREDILAGEYPVKGIGRHI